jgi:hypothetical protein
MLTTLVRKGPDAGPSQKKNQYALRAIFELAKHMDQGPVKISDIARRPVHSPCGFLKLSSISSRPAVLSIQNAAFTAVIFWSNRPGRFRWGMYCGFLTGSRRPPTALPACPRPVARLMAIAPFSSLWIRVKQAAFNIYDQNFFSGPDRPGSRIPDGRVSHEGGFPVRTVELQPQGCQRCGKEMSHLKTGGMLAGHGHHFFLFAAGAAKVETGC